jgi:rubrerythrin
MMQCMPRLQRLRHAPALKTLIDMGEIEERELLRQIIAEKEPEKAEAARRMRARAWCCNRCGYVTRSKVQIRIPAPCLQCGGAIFRVVGR